MGAGQALGHPGYSGHLSQLSTSIAHYLDMQDTSTPLCFSEEFSVKFIHSRDLNTLLARSTAGICWPLGRATLVSTSSFHICTASNEADSVTSNNTNAPTAPR